MRACDALVLATVGGLLAACVSGQTQYTPPGSGTSATNFRVVDRPFEDVWNSAIPKIGKTFFVINNLDKASGLINVSYAGDPEKYLDCGRAIFDVEGPQGKRHFEFPGAVQHASYLTTAPIPGNLFGRQQLVPIERNMSLDGRVNLVFEKIDSAHTRVTATTRYVVTRTLSILQSSRTDSISFTSGGEASFPPAANGAAVLCRPSGSLESDLLAMVS